MADWGWWHDFCRGNLALCDWVWCLAVDLGGRLDMGSEAPVVFMMFAIVLLASIYAAIAWYYGTEDYTWMAQQHASLVLVLITLGIAAFVLVGWLKRRR